MIKKLLFASPLPALPKPADWAVGATLLAARLWLANQFFFVGIDRVKDWDSQAFIFTDINPIPGIPGDVSALAATAGEVTLPVLVALGLLTRIGAAGLFVMTAVIQFIVAQTPQGMENFIGNSEHYTWMAVAAVIAVLGSGRFGIDRYLVK